jgi:catechol 2,3-dioxygenase-like lactoylglutathione lyase family enzyme
MREFFRDTLGLASVDVGGGWLIFALPPAELAAHPSDEHPHHELYLMSDDVHATVEELRGKGVEFTRGISEERWGVTTAFRLPGGGEAGCTSRGMSGRPASGDDPARCQAAPSGLLPLATQGQLRQPSAGGW